MVTRSRVIFCVHILAAERAGDKDANGESAKTGGQDFGGQNHGGQGKPGKIIFLPRLYPSWFCDFSGRDWLDTWASARIWSDDIGRTTRSGDAALSFFFWDRTMTANKEHRTDLEGTVRVARLLAEAEE